MKFPVRVKYRRAEARIYGKSAAYPFYRLCFYSGGKRRVRSFATFGDAKAEADKKVRELAKGNAAASLSPKEALEAISVRDALEAYRRDTGRSFTPLEAVSGFLDAVKALPPGCGLTESVRQFAKSQATIRPKLLGDAVEAFLATRRGKAQAASGKRSEISPVYAAHVESWLRDFAATFPGHWLGDLTRDFLAKYISAFNGLSAKSRNDRRAAVAMFVRWCQRQDFLPATTRLLDADAMQRETYDTAETDFYRPLELRALLEASEGEMRAVIALQGLAGLRLQEALRLTWENVFSIAGHIEVSAQNSKTRSRRLVEINPALAAWLEPFRGMKGPVSGTLTLNGHVSAFARLRESLEIPARRNGLRHGFVTYHFALHSNENLTASIAGNSPAMVHQHYKGLATKKEAEQWFSTMPAGPKNIIPMKTAVAK